MQPVLKKLEENITINIENIKKYLEIGIYL